MKCRAMLLIAALAAASISPALAGPVLDGRFDSGEGYTSMTLVPIDAGDGVFGQLWTFQDAGTQNVYAALNVPLNYVDNTYGANAIGYDHPFSKLVGSDSAEFLFTDGTGKNVFEFKMDYISETGPGVWASKGIDKLKKGSAGSLLDFGTSLDYNFNTLGYVLPVDSPLTDATYTPNPAFPGWEFMVTYEVLVDGTIFSAGFSGVSVTKVHASPHKDTTGSYFPPSPPPPPPGVIPEPSTFVLLGLGMLGLVGSRMRRRKLDTSEGEA